MADYLVLLGPTASGKTAISIELAKQLSKLGYSPEIVNADSMQLYSEMDIATAKLPLEQREQIPHHMFDVSEPEQEMTVVQYQQRARDVITEIIDRGSLPILVGGSMLYLQAVVYKMDFAPTDQQVREQLEAELSETGAEAMLARLQEVDPESAERIELGDTRRIIRALELYQLRGRGLDEFRKDPGFWRDCEIFGIEVDREILRERINKRVENMWEMGLVPEAEKLRGRLSTTASAAIGYQQVEKYIDGEITKEEAIQQIQLLSTRYAKRQRTWFGRDRNIHWLSPEIAVEEIISKARL